MISEQGIIEKVTDLKAIVRVQKSSACANCSSKKSCNVYDRDMLLEVSNDLQAKVGDYVEISVPEGTLLKLSALIYLFPIIALMIGAFLGSFIAKLLEINSSLAAITGGGLFLGIAFYGLKIFEQTKRSVNSHYPKMMRVYASEASPQPCDNK